MTTVYPKRLIEVDLPIKRISAHARREKSIRHGHISTLHIWWARRPLAACRAVVCAALWPDPADPICPQSFRNAASQLITDFAEKVFRTASLHGTVSPESFGQWEGIVKANEQGFAFDTHDSAHLNKLRFALLDFIADFANWDNSTVAAYLETSCALTHAAHESLGGAPGTRPLVVDPFAGGGSIPLEALRVGADVFASDINPVAILLNRVVLEYIPKYGQLLADEVRKWGEWIKAEAEKELAEFYPKDSQGGIPIAYLWARTVRCEGPGCGTEVPLIRSQWLVKKDSRSVALHLVPNKETKRVDFQIIVKHHDVWSNQANPADRIEFPDLNGTVKRGSATCPCCGYTTPVARVREQLCCRNGGTADARMMCVVTSIVGEQGRFYRLPQEDDIKAAERASDELACRIKSHKGNLSLVPEEHLPPQGTLGFRVQLYGMVKWGDLFSPRQLLTLSAILEKTTHIHCGDSDLTKAVQACLALAVGRLADRCCALCTWDPSPTASGILHLFSRQAIPMIWDFAEGLPLEPKSGGWLPSLEWIILVLEREIQTPAPKSSRIVQSTAIAHPLPDDSAIAFITDPPYYDSVPYADLSDFFYVWLKRCLFSLDETFQDPVTPKESECIVDEVKGKDRAFFEKTMKRAMVEGCRILAPDGIGVVVFAHKSTSGWESQLQAMIDAGWIMTGSWPIDTERGSRLRAIGSAVLASSVHLVCRPRESPDGSVWTDNVGDWRDVLAELPRRIHEWMPRLADEGVVGADAIFACLGPALEVFSRYARVEKANGDPVTLREYLEHVWAAVSKEALGMIFQNADASGLEQDARLTAIWFWVLKAARSEEVDHGDGQDEEVDEQSEPASSSKQGFALEFDAARKLAQGLGVDLYELSRPGGILRVSGSISTLFRVSEREQFLFGQQLSLFEDIPPASARRKRLPNPSMSMKAVPQRQEQLFDEEPTPRRDPERPLIPGLVFHSDDRSSLERLKDRGKTTLDRLHQAMLLFGRSQVAMLGPFLIDTGMAFNDKFWILAQSLSALYPPGTEEKRWVDGVLARKKGLGF
jgi:putative DNA methylase